MVHAANEYAQALSHEREERRRAEDRYDRLFQEYAALKRDGYVPDPVKFLPEGHIEVPSTDEDDAFVASRQHLADPDGD